MLRSKIKRVLFGTLSVFLSVVVLAGILEVFSIAFLCLRDRKFIGARERFRRDSNTFLEAITRSGADCRYIDTLFPHPYLAFVHHANPPCGIPYVNNIGLFGQDFPSEKIADRFVVLVTGGSVAAQFAQLEPNGPRYLEQVLNERYISPTGRSFLLLNGADGAWKQPQQMILFLLYVDVIDAVLTLDGFNEHYRVPASLRFEYPANAFMEVNPLATEDLAGVLRDWTVGKLLGFVRQNAVLSRSHAAYLLLQALRRADAPGQPSAPGRRTSVASIFAVPAHWDQPKRFTWAMHQYKKYILAIDAVAQSRGVLAAHFVQPVPAIGKRLTEKEKAVVGDLGYKDTYQQMTLSLLELRERGVNIHSLLDIFASFEDTLYVDPIHCERSAAGDSTGYKLMAEEIAGILARTWSLKARQ